MDSMISESSSVVSSSDVTEDVEVKKLKNLVKKLEKQNEHLRNRTGKLNCSSNKLKATGPDIEGSGDYKPTLKFDDELDSLALLDENDELFDDVDTKDPYTWLFKSPQVSKTKSQLSKKEEEELMMSPEEWLHSDFKRSRASRSVKRNLMSSRPLGQSFNLANSITKSSSEPLHITQPYYTASERLVETLTSDVAMPYPHSPTSIQPRSSNHVQPRRRRRSSHDDDLERNSSSSGSPHHSHHLPVPSQTMTTVHGLLSTACLDESESPQRTKHRSSTPTRVEAQYKGQEKGAQSPRSNSPARKKNVRRTLPTASAIRPRTPRQSLPSNMPPPKAPGGEEGAGAIHTPVIKSSLTMPSARLSHLPARSGLLPPSTPGSRSIPHPRSISPMTSSLPRRSLPRPSQTSTSLRYLPKPSLKTGLTKPTPVAAASVPLAQRTNGCSNAPVDIWGDDDEVY